MVNKNLFFAGKQLDQKQGVLLDYNNSLLFKNGFQEPNGRKLNFQFISLPVIFCHFSFY